MRVMDSELEQSQKQMVDDIAALQESIKTNEAQLDTMERDMPQQPSASMTSVLKRAILFGIIGGVLGGVIICLWVLLSYLADNRLDGAYQVGKLYNIELFAVVSSEEKKRRPLFHKLIDCLEQNASRRQFAGQESAVDYADVSVRSLERQGQGLLTVAAVSSCQDEQVQKLLDSFEQKSGDGVRYVGLPGGAVRPGLDGEGHWGGRSAAGGAQRRFAHPADERRDHPSGKGRTGDCGHGACRVSSKAKGESL